MAKKSTTKTPANKPVTPPAEPPKSKKPDNPATSTESPDKKSSSKKINPTKVALVGGGGRVLSLLKEVTIEGKTVANPEIKAKIDKGFKYANAQDVENYLKLKGRLNELDTVLAINGLK